jgi:hypothetical protein
MGGKRRLNVLQIVWMVVVTFFAMMLSFVRSVFVTDEAVTNANANWRTQEEGHIEPINFGCLPGG